MALVLKQLYRSYQWLFNEYKGNLACGHNITIFDYNNNINNRYGSRGIPYHNFVNEYAIYPILRIAE